MTTLDVFLVDPILIQIELSPVEPEKMRFVYRIETADADDEQLLEDAFRTLNINHPEDYQERSLSVGDVITIAGERSYRCNWVGWQKLDFCLQKEVPCV
jgi:YodL-like